MRACYFRDCNGQPESLKLRSLAFTVAQMRPHTLLQVVVTILSCVVLLAGSACERKPTQPPPVAVTNTSVDPVVANEQPAVDSQPSSSEPLIDPEPTQPPAPAKRAKKIERPTSPIVFQPYFYYRDLPEPSANGTGFFAKGPDRKVVAIGSAHYVDFENSPLLKAEWLSNVDWSVAATLTKSWGPPGNAGSTDPIDLRPDYLIMPVETDVPKKSVLRLDKRLYPKKGERIWFPNKKHNTPLGFEWVGGSVTDSDIEFIEVTLDRHVPMQSQSGSPVISIKTGHVIGTLSRCIDDPPRTIIYLCPASSIRKAIRTATNHPPLEQVVGRG